MLLHGSLLLYGSRSGDDVKLAVLHDLGEEHLPHSGLMLRKHDLPIAANAAIVLAALVRLAGVRTLLVRPDTFSGGLFFFGSLLRIFRADDSEFCPVHSHCVFD